MLSNAPRHRTFYLDELAFFWFPRTWAEIAVRFGRGKAGSHADVRDAIIYVDDEGGMGFLHWYAAKGAWGLTDKGKEWVKDLLSTRRLNAARTWKLPEKELEEAAREVAADAATLVEEEPERRRAFPVTDPDLDAPDGAVVDGYERVGDTWHPRTDPEGSVVHEPTCDMGDDCSCSAAEARDEELRRLAAEQAADED